MLPTMKRTTIWLAQEDKEAIEIIRARYGLSTDSDAIRLALRILFSQKLEVGDECHQKPQDSPEYDARD